MKRQPLFYCKENFISNLFKDTADSLLNGLKDNINSNGVNAIQCDLPALAVLQDYLVSQFPSTKFVHTEQQI